MTQQDGAAEKLKKRCPFIDIIFGTHILHLFGDYLKALDTQKSLIDVWQDERGISENTPVHRTSGLNAWFRMCAAESAAREFNAIVNDVKKLTESGYKEITLLGQNVNSYGSDFDDKNINFALLLERLSEINGKFRIKFMTSHPKDLSEAVVKTISGSEKISKFIHLPVQAGNDRILRLMNRDTLQ
ncbi:cdk5 regulatory subunit-associated protein 1 [Holotrichia oblita]|nr:cdk5 regulatory subunit-associated protein 1 [Holotrichia oblita]